MGLKACVECRYQDVCGALYNKQTKSDQKETKATNSIREL